MKTKIISIVLALVASFANAQPVIQSYASTVPALEASLPSLDNQCEVPDTSVTSVNTVSFGTRIDFPAGTTSATVTSATFSVIKKINGVQATQLSNISMSNSSRNLEGDGSTPNLFSRDASTAIVTPSGSFANNAMPNVRSVFITDHQIPLGSASFPKLVKEGDFYRITRSINVSWTVSAVTQSATLTTESEVVVWFYPTNPPVITGVSQGEGSFNVDVSGVTPDSYGKTWWLQTSIDMGIDDPWVLATNGTVSGNTVVTFPVIEGEKARFWRVGYILNPNPPET